MKLPLRCVIVDDEPLAVKVLVRYIKRHPSLQLISTFNRSIEAIDFLSKNKVDLLLLDIQMPVINGLETLKRLPNPPLCIITTAYREYALEGFELDVIDYLMKPISFERFERAIGKTISWFSKVPVAKSKASEDVLQFSMNRRKHRVAFDDLVYLESRRNTVHIFTMDQNFQCTSTLKEMEERLPKNFIRIHRSYIINSNYIQHFNNQEINLSIHTVPVGSKYTDRLQLL